MSNASLGFQVNTTPVAKAVLDLDALVPAAARAEAATTKMSTTTTAALKSAGASASEFGQRIQQALNMADFERSIQRTVADINVHNRAVANGTTGTKVLAENYKGLSFEAKNLGFQLVDVTQGLLSGQNAGMIFAQQAGQIGQVIATSPRGLGGLVKELGGSIAGLLTPMRLLGVGAVVTAAGAYAMNAAWKTSALQFDDTARAANATVRELRVLQALASGKGIEQGDFLTSSEKFAAAIYQAKNNMGSLAEVLRANGERASTFTGTLGAAANIIQRATSDQQRLQLLQQMGLPATMEWVRLLSGGAEGLRRAAQETGPLNQREQELIDKAREFDEAWAKAWKSFGTTGNNALVNAKAGLSDLLSWWQNKVGALVNPLDLLKYNLQNGGGQRMSQGDADKFYGTFGNRFPTADNQGRGAAVDPNAVQRALSLEQQRISLLGQTASITDQVRLTEIQLQQARLAGVRISETEANTLRELARQRALGIDSIRSQADSYRIEADTIGMSVREAVSYAALHQRLNDARRNGQTLTESNISALTREADALGRAAERADELRFKFDTYQSFFRDMRSSLSQGKTAWESFGDAANNALNKIIDRLLDMATQQLWNAAFPTNNGTSTGGGITSWLSNLFSGTHHTGYGPGDPIQGRYVHPAYFENAPRYHTGIGPGERTAIIKDDESVLTPGQMRALAPANSVRNGDIQVNVINAPAGTTATSQQSRTANGGTRIDITLKQQLDDTGAGLIDSGESAMNRSFERRYGLTPRL